MSDEASFKFEELKLLSHKELLTRTGKILILFQNDKETIAMYKQKSDQLKEMLTKKVEEVSELQRNYAALSSTKYAEGNIVEALEKAKQELELKLAAKDKDIANLNNKIGNYTEEVGILMKAQSSLKQELEIAKKESNENKKLLNKAESAKLKLEAEIKNLNTKLSHMHTESNKETVSKIEALNQIIFKLTEERDNLNKRLNTENMTLSETISKQNIELNKSLEQITQQIKSISKLKKRYKDLQLSSEKDKKAMESEIASLKAELKKYQEMDQSVQSRINELNEQNSILMNKIKSAEEIAMQTKMELDEKNAETAKLSEAEKNAQSTSSLLNTQIEKYRDNINDCQNKLQQLQSSIGHYVNLVNRKNENEELHLNLNKLNKQLSDSTAANEKANEKQLTINRLEKDDYIQEIKDIKERLINAERDRDSLMTKSNRGMDILKDQYTKEIITIRKELEEEKMKSIKSKRN